jgi:hypothetical protein
LTSPLTGFLFPAFNDNSADGNHILYCVGKVNQPNSIFIKDILNCEYSITAEENKANFEEVLKKVMGNKVDTQVISNVFEEIDLIVQENEENGESGTCFQNGLR